MKHFCRGMKSEGSRLIAIHIGVGLEMLRTPKCSRSFYNNISYKQELCTNIWESSPNFQQVAQHVIRELGFRTDLSLGERSLMHFFPREDIWKPSLMHCDAGAAYQAVQEIANVNLVRTKTVEIRNQRLPAISNERRSRSVGESLSIPSLSWMALQVKKLGNTIPFFTWHMDLISVRLRLRAFEALDCSPN
jgi:hypothetical protein